MKKEERIKKEYNKLKKIYADLPDNKKKLSEKLIQNAAFMAVTLEELQDQINAEGAIISQTNGNGFEVVNEHPAQKSYNTMINRYGAVISKLAEMLPTQTTTSKLDAFLND